MQPAREKARTQTSLTHFGLTSVNFRGFERRSRENSITKLLRPTWLEPNGYGYIYIYVYIYVYIYMHIYIYAYIYECKGPRFILMNVLHEDMGYNTPSSCGPYVLGGSLCVCVRACVCVRET